jgi:hypothetical protein
MFVRSVKAFLMVSLSVGILLNLAALSSATPGKTKKVVDCGTSDTGSGEYEQIGTDCTSSQGPYEEPGDFQDAIDDANQDAVNDLNNSHKCRGCPPGEQGCSGTSGIQDPYTSADCTFSTSAGCQGNPFRTLLIATCTKVYYWIYSCDYCSGPQ